MLRNYLLNRDETFVRYHIFYSMYLAPQWNFDFVCVWRGEELILWNLNGLELYGFLKGNMGEFKFEDISGIQSKNRIEQILVSWCGVVNHFVGFTGLIF